MRWCTLQSYSWMQPQSSCKTAIVACTQHASVAAIPSLLFSFLSMRTCLACRSRNCAACCQSLLCKIRRQWTRLTALHNALVSDFSVVVCITVVSQNCMSSQQSGCCRPLVSFLAADTVAEILVSTDSKMTVGWCDLV